MLGAYLAMIDSDHAKGKFEALYNAYKNVVYNIAYGILHDVQLAEDAAIDSFFALAQDMDKIADKTLTQSRNYLIVIVRNRALNLYKKRAHEEYSETDVQDMPDISDVEADVENKETQEKIFSYIKSLDDKYSGVLMLKYFYGLKIPEMARALGISQMNVKIRLSRAKAQLKEKIAEEGIV